MECPQCGFARSPSEKECPRCIQIANLVRDKKQTKPAPSAPATAAETPKRSLCLSCGQILERGDRFCKDCGTPQQASAQVPIALPSEEASALTPLSAPESTTSSLYVALIAVMWTLTVVQIVLVWIVRLNPPTPFVLEAPAFIIAIILAVSRDKTSKGHGWANLTLEAVVLAVVSTTIMLQYRP